MKIDYLCELEKKDIKSSLEEIIAIVSKPKFICEKCARVAKSKRYLCSPVKIIEKSLAYSSMNTTALKS